MAGRFVRGRKAVAPVLLIAALSYPLTAASNGRDLPPEYADFMGSSSTAGLCPAPDSGYIGGWVCWYPMDGTAPFPDDPPG